MSRKNMTSLGNNKDDIPRGGKRREEMEDEARE